MEHTITIKRQSVNWVIGDDHLAQRIPLHCGGERIKDMPTWAMYTATQVACRTLVDELANLLRQSPHYHITDGHLKVSFERLHLECRAKVELTLIISDKDDA